MGAPPLLRPAHRPERAATEFTFALSLNVLHSLFPSGSGAVDYFSLPMHAAERDRAELSKEILADRAIGDRVCALVPRALFDLLQPLARDRYWTSCNRWGEAEAAYREARRLAEWEKVDEAAVALECARFFASRGKTDNAVESFESALLYGRALRADWAKELVTWPAVRKALFARNANDELYFDDAVFPADPFAH